MRNTKIMLAAIATYIVTWTFIAFAVWVLSTNITFRECAILEGVLIFQFMFGWIPSVIVIQDLV
jgi:hypothetical protein